MPESLRLYQLCKATKFAALPWPGGMYDQHPQLIEEWTVIIECENRALERDLDQQKRQARSRARRR